MINHIRTLLLNSRQPTDDPAPWDRYIPEDFQPLELPVHLDGIRVGLVGRGGWWDLTYRVESLLEAVYSPRYDGKFPWVDKKVTPPKVQPFLYTEPEFAVTWVPASGADVFISHLTVPYPSTTAIPAKRTWRVTASGSALFNVYYGYTGAQKSIMAYSDPDAGGWRLPLDADVDLLFSGFGTDGDIWQVTSYKKPQNVFRAYPLILRALPSSWTSQLFNSKEPSDAPLAEYKRWYDTCVFPEDPVVAVVLAYTLQVSKLL